LSDIVMLCITVSKNLSWFDILGAGHLFHMDESCFQ
jgi:hypothetical protein